MGMPFKISARERWEAKFRSAYPFDPEKSGETDRLRLILGVGRSGTSWVSQVLFKTPMPCRCFSEPLFHIVPPLPFQKSGDHTALGYQPFQTGHPLLRAYQLLADRQFAGTAVQTLQRNDAGWEACVVKEVHSLLGTEGLLRQWRTPTAFILRDPVYIIDSLFAAQTLQTIYLDHEVEAVQAGPFVERFVPKREAEIQRRFADAARREPRLRLILGKVLCVQLLQEMFSVLAAEFPSARVLRYEELCAAPRAGFLALAATLSIPWDDAMDAYLSHTTAADVTSSDPYSVVRNTSEQSARALKFLSASEAAACREALQAITGDNAKAAR